MTRSPARPHLLASCALLALVAACSACRTSAGGAGPADLATAGSADLAAARPDTSPGTDKDAAAPGAAPARYLALGDSYTIGESVAASERWPVQLRALLAAAGVTVAAPEIIARTGWTTDELSAGIDAAKPRGPYAMVSLLVGVNDQYRGGSATDYEPRFAKLLGRAITYAGGDAARVIVLSIPDWGVTPFAPAGQRDTIAAAIDAFNAVNRKVSAARGVAYVDVTPVSREAKSDGSLLAADGLHPSGKMYKRWAELALPAARAALARARSTP